MGRSADSATRRTCTASSRQKATAQNLRRPHRLLQPEGVRRGMPDLSSRTDRNLRCQSRQRNTAQRGLLHRLRRHLPLLTWHNLPSCLLPACRLGPLSQMAISAVPHLHSPICQLQTHWRLNKTSPTEAPFDPPVPPVGNQAASEHDTASRCLMPSAETPSANTSPEPHCKRPRTQQPRLFLDLFAGIHSPLSQAMHALQCDYFTPFDLARHPSHDILDDRVTHLLLRLAFSGLVGVIWSAPPCKEFSMLKLRRPGPKPLRTPQHMDGLPTNSPEEQARVDASTAIHARSRRLIRAVLQAAGQGGFEQPPSTMSKEQCAASTIT